MTYFSSYPQHFKVSRSQLQNVIEWKFRGNLMYFISYLTDVLTMTKFFALPQTFNTAKLLVLNRFTEAPRGNFKFGGNLSFFYFVFDR